MKQWGRIISVTLHKPSDLTPISYTGARGTKRAEQIQGETTEEELAVEKALAGFDFVCCADSLLITKAAAGALENYNCDSDGDARVYPGDYIVSVNGKKNPVRMSSELKDGDGETWELKVERAPVLRVELSKPAGTQLGLELSCKRRHAFLRIQIASTAAASGAAAEYNRANPQFRLKAGQHILEVNNKRIVFKEMVQEFQDMTTLSFVVRDDEFMPKLTGSGQTFIDSGLVGAPTNGERAAFEEQQPLVVEEPPAQALEYASPHNTRNLEVEMPDPDDYVELTFKTLALDDVRPKAFEAILRDKLVIMGMGVFEMRDMTHTITDGLSVQLRGTVATIKHLKKMQLTKLEIMGCKAEVTHLLYNSPRESNDNTEEVPQLMMEEESLHASAPRPPTESLLDEAVQVVMKVREREEHWEATEDVPQEGRPRQQPPHVPVPMPMRHLLERAPRRTLPTPSPPQEVQAPARAPVAPALVLQGSFREAGVPHQQADLGHHHVAAQSAVQQGEVAESARRRREDEAKYQLQLEQSNKEAVGFIERASELIDQLQTPREDAFLMGTGDGGTGAAGGLLLRPGVGGPETDTEKEPPPGMQGRYHSSKNCDRACDGIGESCTVQ
mmetsp:Transcript_165525/g.526328  ORF Transcript_165525/g.526328 Transcript_165525/m.526328 type:complete len:615 (+) Transcript_165525:155-1999(+)